MPKLISQPKSIIPACDVDTWQELGDLVMATCVVPGIGGYKIGFDPILFHGLPWIVEMIRNHGGNLPIIYDHHKAGNDTPDMGSKFANILAKAGVNATILFPFSGPATQRDWTQACQDAGLTVLIGGHMTHKRFLQSEGGYIADNAPSRIYELGVAQGVRDFVVPGNKVEFVDSYRKLIERLLGNKEFTLYAPGFGNSQGGDISQTGQVAGDNWHPIVGRDFTNLKEIGAIREAAQHLTQQIQVPA